MQAIGAKPTGNVVHCYLGSAALLLVVLVIAPTVLAIAQTPVMTNSAIQSMLRASVPLDTIIRSIKTAAMIDLKINDSEYAQLSAAGASPGDADQIMKAIHDREYNGAENTSGRPANNEKAEAPPATPADSPPSPPRRSYSRTPSATTRFKTSVGDFSIWVDETKWKLTKNSTPNVLQFYSVNGEMMAGIQTAKIGMPTDVLIETVIKHSMESDPNSRIRLRDRRIVNGHEVAALGVSGTFLGVRGRCLDYSHGGTSGTIQAIVVTAENAFDRNLTQITDFLNGLEISDDELPPAPIITELTNAGNLVLNDVGISLKYNPKKWRQIPSGAARRLNLVHAAGDGYALITTERVAMPFESLPMLALLNARKRDPNAVITLKERRSVNGLDVWFVRMEASTIGVPFTYFGYYYSCDAGTVQAVAYTGRKLAAEYQSDFFELLNGLHAAK
jgi:hypothetical protein